MSTNKFNIANNQAPHLDVPADGLGQEGICHAHQLAVLRDAEAEDDRRAGRRGAVCWQSSAQRACWRVCALSGWRRRGHPVNGAAGSRCAALKRHALTFVGRQSANHTGHTVAADASEAPTCVTASAAGRSCCWLSEVQVAGQGLLLQLTAQAKVRPALHAWDILQFAAFCFISDCRKDSHSSAQERYRLHDAHPTTGSGAL